MLFLVAGIGCGGTAQQEPLSSRVPPAGRFAVAADHPLASLAGARMFEQGGNVVDAAVATSLALAVVRPYSMGIGGGGFMLIKLAGEDPVALDYRETAPAGASVQLYVDGRGGVIDKKTVWGPFAVGVPGHLQGMAHALEHYGTLPLSLVIAPAIELAEQGVTVDGHTHRAMVRLAEVLDQHSGSPFLEIEKIFLKEGAPLAVGDTLVQPDLGATLRRIADMGIADFYEGELARRIVAELTARGGILGEADLAGYQLAVRSPLTTRFRGFKVVGMPPPSSGGACLQQILTVLDGYDPRAVDRPTYTHVLVESMKHAFADRAAFLGDSDVHPGVTDDVSQMLQPETAAAIRASIGPVAVDPARYGKAWLTEDGGTSHYSIIDSRGNAVAGTDTINLTFGSLVVPPGTGIVLNNQLDDFAVKADVANEYGLKMSSRNVISPGQRPLSSMSPTILLEQGRAVLSAGASGGPKIITATLQSILQVVDFGVAPKDAVAAKRLHHQWSPGELLIEPGVDSVIVEQLQQWGHRIELAESPLGVCQMTTAMGGTIEGASDPRKGGQPVIGELR